MKVREVRHRWTNEDARKLYEALAEHLQEMTRKRAVDLGISMDDGDEKTAFELLKLNRRRRMSERHRAEVLESWAKIIDPHVKRMADILGTYTVPEIIVVSENPK